MELVALATAIFVAGMVVGYSLRSYVSLVGDQKHYLNDWPSIRA